MRLENKKIIITGGTGGIGSKFAEGLVAAGAQVALVARDQNKLDALRHKLGADKVFAVSANMSQMAEVERAFREIWEHFGQVDAVVLAAGTHQPLHIDHNLAEVVQSEREMHEAIFLPCYNGGSVAQKLFRQQGHGLIANISSHAATRTDLEGNLSYASYKAASRAFILSLRHELGLIKGNKVHVTDIQPATVNTPGNAKWLPTEEKRKAAIQPEEMVAKFIEHFDDPHLPAEITFKAHKAAEFKPR